ncbi:metallophosphoesterase family protein [Enterococcus hermanniensis]|uniref:Calcineurin-like phosphoesterase domain-containing protein n=1 Tax=Enterococcus hermanniensis TaxID=249189 RepID=A0A1L8TP43_9ENTE|nr:metallophosphoesterase [Enterococcus hermanniensis]OJG46105.1 hypothetical protein RV04_GL001271 [Enterococcus hermanniensis]
MKSKKNELKISVAPAHIKENPLPQLINQRIELYPENKRRPINKTIFRNEYFQLTFNTRDQSMAISSKGDLVYSAIPYDTARNYIQRAAIQYLLHPAEARSYIESHKENLEKYLMLSLFQTTHQKVTEDSIEVKQAYQAIFKNPLLEIQILGRLMQHDETGPLSANLAGKFLFSENVKTGIAGYISEYLAFVVQLTQALPLMIDGQQVQLIENTEETLIGLNYSTDITPGLSLLPQPLKQSIQAALADSNQEMLSNTRPLLRSEYGAELSRLRENYVAHSVRPDNIADHFKNVHSNENRNLINVISDIHAKNGELPIVNRHFNLFIGDISESRISDSEIKGLYVIGGHELVDSLPQEQDQKMEVWDKWRPYFNDQWFQELMRDSDEQWYSLPLGNHTFYSSIQTAIQHRFPKMHVLNNEVYTHEGIRYVGLTIPVVLIERKKAQQEFILRTLKKLLKDDYETPIVILSHAPLFNELSMLSPQSSAYSNQYDCDNADLEKVFQDYPILGVIHGHHHIPASSRRFQKVTFANRQLFVVCSIYSKINTGFDLSSLLENTSRP